MGFHFPVNNYRATLGAPLAPTDLEIVLDEGGGGPLTQMPCFVSIGDEIIEVQERKRAHAMTGAEGTDRTYWIAVQDGDAGNGVSITLADPGANGSPLSIAVSGNAVTVNLATDENGDLASSVDDILTALAANVAASGLLFAFSEDSGVVSAATEAILSGGDNDILYVTEDYGGRGAQGTTPSSHSAGASVDIRCTAEHLSELQMIAGIHTLYPSQFAVHSGTPSLDTLEVGASSGHKTKAWKFAPSEDGAISLLFVLLPTFRGRRLKVLLFWYSKEENTGDCLWTLRGKAMNWMFGPTVGGQPEVVVTDVCGAPGPEQITMFETTLEFPGMGIGGGPMTLVIARDGASAEDTFTGDAWLLEAVVLEAE